MQDLIIFAAGLAAGAFLTAILMQWFGRRSELLARELAQQAEARKAQDLENIIQRMKDSFGSLSLDALRRNTEEFLKLANETLDKKAQAGRLDLDSKKQLIDQTLGEMKESLCAVGKLMNELEKDREKKFGELSGQLRAAAEQTGKLKETADKLREALASSQARGQWGERMAEDVLRLAGFIEGVNYLKQNTQAGQGSRPDFTFLLPQGKKVNMDVKFPLDNYVRCLDAESDSDKEEYKRQFLSDVRGMVKAVKNRDYINPEENTVDYVIVFIPNEQVYAFVHQHDRSLLDDALRSKVILCSPLTLYAVLAVIRQAMDNFRMEEKAGKIIALLEKFRRQWEMYVESFGKLGKKLEEAKSEYDNLVTTRRTQLERPLRDIDEIKALPQPAQPFQQAPSISAAQARKREERAEAAAVVPGQQLAGRRAGKQ